MLQEPVALFFSRDTDRHSTLMSALVRRVGRWLHHDRPVFSCQDIQRALCAPVQWWYWAARCSMYSLARLAARGLLRCYIDVIMYREGDLKLQAKVT